LRQAAGDGQFVGGLVVELPEVNGDVGDERGGGVAGFECAGVEVYGYALGQGVADMGPADAQKRAPVALVDNRRETREWPREECLDALGRSRVFVGQPLVWSRPDESDIAPSARFGVAGSSAPKADRAASSRALRWPLRAVTVANAAPCTSVTVTPGRAVPRP
jgi:hypothetical protein